jgi:cytosine deaminase
MTSAGRYPLVLRGGRIGAPRTAPEVFDVAVGADGRIARLGRDLAVSGVEELDLGGRLIVPGLVDVHQHLDKSRIVRRAPNPTGTLLGALDAFRRFAPGVSREEIVERARSTVEACLARGTVAIRSHTNVDLEWELRAVEALVEVRERVRDRVRLQIVAFVTSSGARGAVGRARGLLESALDAGADVVGGAPALAPDPAAFTDMLFEVAARRERRLDLHVDENLDPRHRQIEEVIRQTRERRLQGRVVASHCCSLSALPPSVAKPIIEDLAEARIGIVTLPAANLFLQGREADALAPRGLTRVPDLLAAGVPVACASDNIQDPFVPVGTGDMIELGRWTLLAAHLLSDGLGAALRMITTTPAGFMGLDADYGVNEGALADLLVVNAADAEDMLMTGPLERTVFFHGRHVAGPALPPARPIPPPQI